MATADPRVPESAEPPDPRSVDAGTPDPASSGDGSVGAGPLALESREGLPDALRVLLDQHPREAWAADPHFHGLVSMWLDRHLSFRRILGAMQGDVRGLLDRQMEPRAYGARLSRLGSHFVSDLHGHHHIEDDHYFPILAAREPRIARGFEILDLDHKALDVHLAAFVEGANGLLQAVDRPVEAGVAAGRLEAGLGRLHGVLDRHLTDEEELIVPVILRAGGHV